MTKKSKVTAIEFSREATEIITRGIEGGKSKQQIQKLIKDELGEKLTQKQIDEFMKGKKQKVSRSLLFKNSGAHIVREFLEKIKEGEDVSHIQAVLEHAVYVDCLNRYSVEEDAFSDWDIKDVIKVTNDYKKMRLKSSAGEKLSGALAAQLIHLIRGEFTRNSTLKKAYQVSEAALFGKLEKLVVEDSLKDELAELDYMQNLYEEFQKEKGLNANV